MSELKPCPFCGEENTDTGFILHKDECYLMLRYMGGHSKHEMINAWNTRPIEDALCNDIALLRSQKAGLEQTVNEQAIEIQQANAEIDRLKSERLRWTKGGNGSHWDGCEEVHWDCKIVKLQAEIDRLKAERRWIPVSERLPEKRGAYYVYLSDDFGFRPDMDFFENGDWNSYTVGDVTHWMPLPAEPPEGEA